MPKVNLYQEPAVTKFYAPADSFTQAVEEIDTSLQVLAINAPEDLQLHLDGTTISHGLRFTKASFNKIARLLGSGACQLFPDIAGYNDVWDSPDKSLDVTIVINFWNTLVDARFYVFEKYRFVKQSSNNMIVDIVGVRYQHLDNLVLYNKVWDKLHTWNKNIQFHSAAIKAHNMYAWFVDESQNFTITVDAKDYAFYAGYALVCNRESRVAVKFMTGVFCKFGKCWDEVYKLSRSDSRPYTKLSGILDKALNVIYETPIQKLKDGDQLNRSLRHVDSNELTNKLVNLSLDRGTAERITACSLLAGRNMKTPEFTTGKIITRDNRKIIDVFAQILTTACDKWGTQQESLECVGYKVLLGKLKI